MREVTQIKKKGFGKKTILIKTSTVFNNLLWKTTMHTADCLTHATHARCNSTSYMCVSLLYCEYLSFSQWKTMGLTLFGK